MAHTEDRPCRAGELTRGLVVVVALVVALAIAAVVRLVRRPGRARGVLLRLAGRRPDPDVDDRTLADRVRSELGPVLKDLDLPHVHVMVEDHVAHLHGDVRWPREAAAIERAVLGVSGVRDVRCHLHHGLLPSDTPPSRGRADNRPPSAVKARLLAAAASSGVDEEHTEAVVLATLAAFTERVPADERRQLVAHLPEDVRNLLGRVVVPDVSDVRTLADLVAAVGSIVDPTVRCDATAVCAVLHELRRAVPEEAADVLAVLPNELREVWSEPAEL